MSKMELNSRISELSLSTKTASTAEEKQIAKLRLSFANSVIEFNAVQIVTMEDKFRQASNRLISAEELHCEAVVCGKGFGDRWERDLADAEIEYEHAQDELKSFYSQIIEEINAPVPATYSARATPQEATPQEIVRSIKLPPGTRLLQLTELVFSPKTKQKPSENILYPHEKLLGIYKCPFLESDNKLRVDNNQSV